jgi:Zn-dependent alcohol dehydrogenase
LRADAPLERLCGLACGVSTGLGAALLRADVKEGESALVIGAGGVGLSTLMGARLRGAALRIAVDVLPQSSRRRSPPGSRRTRSTRRASRWSRGCARSRTDAAPTMRSDAVGAPGTLELALEATRPGGTCVVIGHAHGVVTAAIDTSRLLRQRWLTGTFGGSIVAKRDIPRFVDLYLADCSISMRSWTRNTGSTTSRRRSPIWKRAA